MIGSTGTGQQAAVSLTEDIEGQKVRPVGGRSKRGKKKETDLHSVQTVEVAARGCWGHQNLTCAGYIHGK